MHGMMSLSLLDELCVRLECHDLRESEVMALFQFLIDRGEVWRMPLVYQEVAEFLLSTGKCRAAA